MRRKKSQPQENHERWLVSYADFITLLFAFFVVMFATAQADKGTAQQVSESVKNAINEGKLTSVVSVILGGAAQNHGQGNAMMKGPGGTVKSTTAENKPPVAADLQESMRVLSDELRREIEKGRLQVSMEARGLTVSFKQAALFPSGTDEIDPAAYGSTGKVAEAIAKLPNPVRLEGHTDAVPIHNGRYRSNWDLSAARAIAMLELLTGKFGVPREKMSIGGYAETAPIDDNGTEEGRGRNRRVDIIILNQTGILGEPGSHWNQSAKPSPVAGR